MGSQKNMGLGARSRKNSRKNFIPQSKEKMTRGNQRELSRAKNAKKEKGSKDQSKTEANKGMTLEQRKQRDAEALRAKQAKKRRTPKRKNPNSRRSHRPSR